MSGRERARELLVRLDPLVRLDDGPYAIDLARERGRAELCVHAPGYHADPYGVLYRVDARLGELVELLGWEIAAKVPEVARLEAEFTRIVEEGAV